MYLVFLAFSLGFCVGLVPRGVFWGVLRLPLQQEHCNRGNSDYASSIRGERSPRVA